MLDKFIAYVVVVEWGLQNCVLVAGRPRGAPLGTYDLVRSRHVHTSLIKPGRESMPHRWSAELQLVASIANNGCE